MKKISLMVAVKSFFIVPVAVLICSCGGSSNSVSSDFDMARIKEIAAKPAEEWTAEEANEAARYSLAGFSYVISNFKALCDSARSDYEAYEERGWDAPGFTINPFDSKAADILYASEQWPEHPMVISKTMMMIHSGDSKMDEALKKQLLDSMESHKRYTDVFNAIGNSASPDGYMLLQVFDEYRQNY